MKKIKFKETQSKTIESNRIEEDSVRKDLNEKCNRISSGEYIVVRKTKTYAESKESFHDKPYLIETAAAFRAARAESGLTVRDMERVMGKIGIYSKISTFENVTKSPTLRTVNSYASAIGYKMVVSFNKIKTEEPHGIND